MVAPGLRETTGSSKACATVGGVPEPFPAVTRPGEGVSLSDVSDDSEVSAGCGRAEITNC